MFLVSIISLSFVCAWLRVRSGSLWTAVVLHAAHNMFVRSIFTRLTMGNDITPYIIDELVLAWRGLPLLSPGSFGPYAAKSPRNDSPLAMQKRATYELVMN
jgi:membrane protease YdiL (CAAX protease family)